MSASTGPVRLRRRGRPLRWTALTTGGVLAAGLFALVAPTGPAAYAAAPGPDVTRAAIAPSLTAGRGADVPFVEQEAENAVTDGTIIGPSTQAYTLAAEASGRSAVSLAPGQYVQFTLPAAANAINVRYSIPDSPTGGGITAPLDVQVNGSYRRTMTLTSQYSWLYGQYPYDNDPTEGDNIPTDYAVECQCVPAQTRSRSRFSRRRGGRSISTPSSACFSGEPFPAGSTDPPHRSARYQRGTHDHRSDGLATRRPAQVRVRALSTCCCSALTRPGTATRPHAHQRCDRVRSEGAPAGLRATGHLLGQPAHHRQQRHDRRAGSWYTIFKGHQVTLSSPAPDGSIHTGVGFYGLYASAGRQHQRAPVRLRDRR